MATAGFPADTYTPHGYLANPFAVARSWTDGEGGCLRTSRQHLGLGWQLPWSLRAHASVDLIVAIQGGGRRFVRRADFDPAGLVSPHHSSTLLVYRWEALGRRWEAAYTLVQRDTLGLEIAWQAVDLDQYHSVAATDPDSPMAPDMSLTIGLVGWRRGDSAAAVEPALRPAAPQPTSRPASAGVDGWVDLGPPYGRCALIVAAGAFERADPAADQSTADAIGDPTGDATERAVGSTAAVIVRLRIGAAPTGSVRALARREAAGTGGPLSGRPGEAAVSAAVAGALVRAREADAAFWVGAARLEGDWPPAWRRGWVYDLETTRMCVFPPGGIFADVWPAWMVQWPRAVVAEGTLDMVRLAYASPEPAMRAILSLFRDATAPNVPCVFQHGEPNMVAVDGSVCGTSPAWCVPFYNLERLFSLALDRSWLAAIYPYLARYVDWWLAERTDADGWAVYKCTWEAGEDDTPRLDPERRGDNVVSAFVRPVELQATMAFSAAVLARFADVLGDPAAAARWRTVEADFARRSRSLWDAREGRFRDWDARAGQFLMPSGASSYWGVDPCRYSALAFTPLLAGLVDAEQRDGLGRELRHYTGPPWTLWASWSYLVLEAALLAGERALAGRVAAEIVGRVYDELDAREIASPAHPTPGVAREYWPLDLDSWASCEGYGWGANTASLLMRQIFGFLEGPYLEDLAPRADTTTDSAARGPAGWRVRRLQFRLAPSLPPALLVPGREYRVASLPYRGARLTLGYRVEPPSTGAADRPGNLALLVSAGGPTHCQVADEGGERIYSSERLLDRHEIAGLNGGCYDVELTAPA
jgi:hypothetical protein